MCIGVVGGMARLEQHYLEEARGFGFELKVFNRFHRDMASRLRRVDALVIFTNKVSHNARREALRAARESDIPVFQYHSCGLCTFRDCLKCISRPVSSKSPEP